MDICWSFAEKRIILFIFILSHFRSNEQTQKNTFCAATNCFYKEDVHMLWYHWLEEKCGFCSYFIQWKYFIWRLIYILPHLQFHSNKLKFNERETNVILASLRVFGNFSETKHDVTVFFFLLIYTIKEFVFLFSLLVTSSSLSSSSLMLIYTYTSSVDFLRFFSRHRLSLSLFDLYAYAMPSLDSVQFHFTQYILWKISSCVNNVLDMYSPNSTENCERVRYHCAF